MSRKKPSISDYIAEQTKTVSRYYVGLLLHKPTAEVTEAEIANERARIFAYRERLAQRPDRFATAREVNLKLKERLADGYVRTCLGLKKADCPQQLLELKRAQLKIKHKLKALNEQRI